MNLEEQLRELFVEEAGDTLRDFEQALLLLESLPDDPELISKLFRNVHTLKGNSRILSFTSIETFAHQLENLLDSLRRHELIVNEPVADALLVCLDVLKELVAEVAGGPAHNLDAYRDASARVGSLLTKLVPPDLGVEPPPVPDEPTRVSLAAQMYEANPRPASVRPPTAGASAPSLRSASIRPPTMMVASSGPPPTVSERSPQPRAAATPASPVAPAAVNAPPPAAAGKARKPSTDAESNSVRVPIDKLDRLINLTGEVVIAQSIIAQLVTDLTPERVNVLQEVVAQMDRHCRELQERMLGARMLPLRNVFTRFHRLVRDLSGTTGKSLRLEITGEETELDKTVIEKISDPLTHLIRNAVDHGIELPEQRRAAGKPEQACVRLEAYQKGGNIFIEVADDGRGIDRERVLNKAVEQGLVRAGTVLSDEEVYSLIFQAGFSTAEKVTEISGRGVGMDVVKRNVEALKGSIVIISEPGQGTCFRVKLPLTLAILDGLGVRVGSETYLVPLVSVVESLQPKATDVYDLPNAGEVVDVRGEYLPLMRLHRLFELTPSFYNPHEGLVMVIDDGSQKLALQIDELLGQYQVVIKSLETNFQAIPGIAGATVLGDGRVALILDTGNLATVAKSRALASPLQRDGQSELVVESAS
jgi:two-component system, chemotaxis family, sensor kinase CheA